MDLPSQTFATELRAILGNHIRKLVLFGSRARRDGNAGSDCDMLVVVDAVDKPAEDAVIEASVRVLDSCGVLVGSILCNEQEWEEKKRFPIGLNILAEGVEV